jgi:hypothetical protein
MACGTRIPVRSLVTPATPSSPGEGQSSRTLAPAKPRHFGRNVLIVALVVSVAALLTIVGLYTIPVAHPFSRTSSASGALFGTPATTTIDPPTGDQVSGTYTSAGGGIGLLIEDSYGDLVWSSPYGTSDSFSFTSEYPPYTFISDAQTMTITGDIYYPTL